MPLHDLARLLLSQRPWARFEWMNRLRVTKRGGRGLLVTTGVHSQPASEREARMDDPTRRCENDTGNETRLPGPPIPSVGPFFLPTRLLVQRSSSGKTRPAPRAPGLIRIVQRSQHQQVHQSRQARPILHHCAVERTLHQPFHATVYAPPQARFDEANAIFAQRVTIVDFPLSNFGKVDCHTALADSSTRCRGLQQGAWRQMAD